MDKQTGQRGLDSRGLVRPKRLLSEQRVAGALFFATCWSVFLVYLFSWEASPLTDPGALVRSGAFTTVLMGMLLAHELGHYAVARLHGFRLSLPWFLPAPLWVGTLGAIIRLREEPDTRTGLLEMGAAGPLAGLAVIAVGTVGRLWVGDIAPPGAGDPVLAAPFGWHLVSWLVTGEAAPAIGPGDPVAFALWIGALVTAMNLIPFGQLDGGHIVASLIPDQAEWVSWGVTGVLLLAGFVWPMWAIWAAVLHLLGTRKPLVVRRPRSSPSPRAVWIALACLVAFALCFHPQPLTLP